jgi:hypothetical protein
MPLVTPLPTPPSSTDPTNFNTRADAFLGALPTLATEVNTVGTNMETQYNYVAANVSTTAASASQATTAANSAVSAKNSIEVLFLGSKTSNPTTNNSGGALVVGCKYFNTTVGEDRVWTGTNWVASTALGGTVASLNVDGVLKLKHSTWHNDSLDARRLYLENDGFGNGLRTVLRGNELNFWNNADAEVFKVVSNGGMLCTGQASIHAAGSFLSAHSLTVGTSVGIGVAPGGNGAYGVVGSDSNHLFVGANTYYAAGNDRFSVNGYAPKIRMFKSDNTILFQQTDNGIAGNEQAAQNVASFESDGSFVHRGRNGSGYTALVGGSVNSGRVEFFRPGGERTGYVGYAGNSSGSPNLIVADNNHPWVFSGKAPQSDMDATASQELTRLSQFPSSNTTNGYTKLPNGFIIQWGTVTLPYPLTSQQLVLLC